LAWSVRQCLLPWSLPIASQASLADLMWIAGIACGHQANKIRHLRLSTGFQMRSAASLNLIDFR
jgi:hypothetical protein